MHELSLAMDIVETVKKSVEGRNVERVTHVELELGEFSFVTPEQLKHAFEMVSQDTIAGNAKLKIKVRHGKIHCTQCGYEGKVKVDAHGHSHMVLIKCPKCRGTAVEILGGKEIIVKNIKALVKR